MRNEDELKKELIDCTERISVGILSGFLMDVHKTVAYYEQIRTGNTIENRESNDAKLQKYTTASFSRIPSEKLKNIFYWDQAKLLWCCKKDIEEIVKRKGAI